VIRPGEEWGSPTSSPPDLEVAGSDADLAAAVAAHRGALIRFRPDPTSDLAGAVGIPVSPTPANVSQGIPEGFLATEIARVPDGSPVPLGIELVVDALQVTTGPAALDQPLAVNMVVLGSPPDALTGIVRRFGANVRVDGKTVFHGPCTTIVIATGQFRHGLDLVPRGHPGDGRAELQIYAVPARQRRQLRARLATGTHVPHPNITQRSAKSVSVSIDRRVALEVDGRPRARADQVDLTVVPNAYRLLV
jgi:hypothetical protein